MKCTIAAIIMAISSMFSKGQTTIALYDVEPLQADRISKDENPQPGRHKMHLVFNDSISMQYFSWKSYKPTLLKKEPWGAYYIAGARFSATSDRFIYKAVSSLNKPTKKEWKLFKQEKKPLHWYRLKGEKEILGYKAHPAIAVELNQGVHDTILVWYTDQIKMTNTDMPEFANLGGLPVEISDQRTNDYILISSIETSDLALIFPRKIEVIDEEGLLKEFEPRHRSRYPVYTETKIISRKKF